MRFINVSGCTQGMCLARDIKNFNGITLLHQGTELKPSHIETLKKLGYRGIYVNDMPAPDPLQIALDGDDEPTPPLLPDGCLRQEAVIRIYDVFKPSAFEPGTIQHDLLHSVTDVLEQVIEQISSNHDAVVSVFNLEHICQYNYQHSVNVAVLSVLIAREMGLQDKLPELGMAALFHDIGNMFVPQSILNKPDYLDDKEFEKIKRHPVLGYDYLKDIVGLSELVCQTALYHHERYGSPYGYPGHKSGLGIPLYARIVAVADSYDAMVSKRPYREALPPDEAARMIRCLSGSYYDPCVVNAFAKVKIKWDIVQQRVA